MVGKRLVRLAIAMMAALVFVAIGYIYGRSNTTPIRANVETVAPPNAATSSKKIKTSAHSNLPSTRNSCRHSGWDWDYIVMPATLSWTRGQLPKDMKSEAIKAFGISKKELDAGEPDYFNYAFVDLVDDEKPEVIIEHPAYNGSGGASFVFLQKRGDHWMPLTEFLGGFLLLRGNNKFEDLIIYERNGDSYHRVELKYSEKAHRYRFHSRLEIPRELHDLDSGWLDFWNFFWFLAGGREAKCDPLPSNIAHPPRVIR